MKNSIYNKVYIYNKDQDAFILKYNLLNLLGRSTVLNELLVDSKGKAVYLADVEIRNIK